MIKKNETPKNLQTALDCAIRDYEKEKSGYIVKDGNNDCVYYNYMSNDAWKSYKEEMSDSHRQQFVNGNGGELDEKKGRWGKYPPKMASFGSSSRMIYELSKDIPGFCFEKKLVTRVGGKAHLDGFIQKGSKYIYVEAKRREVYYSSHEGEEIKEVYIPVYEKIRDICGEEKFKFDAQDAKDRKKKVTFYLNKTLVQYFDLKQLICHFLGITYDLAKNNVKDAEVKFVYLIYNPDHAVEVNGKIEEKYREGIINRYKDVTKFINDNKAVIKKMFNAVLKYQIEHQKLQKVNIKFEFKLVDQKHYKV